MIKIVNIAKAFGGAVAVNDVSLHVRRQEIFGLVGPDGAGKTTLLRMVCGLITPDRGSVSIMDGDPRRVEQAKENLGYMPQRFSLYGDLTVMENIDFFGSMYRLSRETIRQRAGEVFAITKLSGFENRLADNLSGGMKQKLALTCALITRPEILVLDEPTYGVDPESRKDFWRILYQLNQEGRTILVTTPYMDEAELCHEVALIDQGRIVRVDSPLQLKRGFRRQLLEVRAGSRDPDLFRGMDAVLDSSFYGDKYHLVVADAAAAREAVAGHLAALNIPVYDLRQVSPTMEDIFVSLAEHAPRRAKRAPAFGRASGRGACMTGAGPVSPLNGDYAVVTQDLTKRFGGFTAVDRITMNIRRGEICGFLGPNGAGKTTAIRMLCGILEPTSGTGSVLGYDIAGESEQIKRRLGYMSQKFSLYEDLTVHENLDFYGGLYGIPGRERSGRIAEMVAMAGLAGREQELVANLSGGWRQRLALGCAIIARPSIVFLDEPTSGVSPTSRRHFFNIIQGLANQGITVIVATHFMDEAERCSKIAFISGGRLLALDSPDRLKSTTLDGFLVELELPGAVERIGAIEALPYVRECSLHGPLLHVLIESEARLAELREFVGAEPRPVTPSLEDVFIALARKSRAAAGAIAPVGE